MKTHRRAISFRILAIAIGFAVVARNDFGSSDTAEDPADMVESQLTRQIPEGPLDAPGSTTNEVSQSEIALASNEPNNREYVDSKNLFFEPSDQQMQDTMHWVDEEFMPGFDGAGAVIRTNVVSVDALALEALLAESFEAGQRGSGTIFEALSLKLFPDRKYELAADWHRIGSTGFSNFQASLVSPTGLGREYFQFEISPTGKVYGRGVTATGVYTFHETPDPNILLVVDVDEDIVSSVVKYE